MTDRRAFIGSAAAGALLLSSRANSQPAGKLPRVALVLTDLPLAAMREHPIDRAFVRGLNEVDVIEGRDIIVERRSAEGHYDRLPSIIRELLALPVDVIVVTGRSVKVAAQATTTVPIVSAGIDPLVELGLAASLARPGRNVTGVTNATDLAELNGTRLALLRQAAPRKSRVAWLGLARAADDARTSSVAASARALGLTIVRVGANTIDELKSAFDAIAKERANALLVDNTSLNYVHIRRITEFAARFKLPAIYGVREGPEAGGLMSYGTNVAEDFRRAAGVVQRIIRGAKPSELPIEQPTKYEFVLNMKTARMLDLAMPEALLLRADELIQ